MEGKYVEWDNHTRRLSFGTIDGKCSYGVSSYPSLLYPSRLYMLILLITRESSLSRQLYDKETHFLLELIQNADDNTYDCAIPSLDFTYRRGSLRVDCNEIGFTESNVRAICKIGESTKVGLGQSTRYIGEKGIGFKSVFKVASVVYISSGNFSFKFDQSQLVGIIAPVWSDFPEPTLPGYTSFYLQLFEDCDEDQFAYDIRHLDLKMLIFLKQLRQINLNFILDDGQVQTRRLWREDLLAGGSVVTRLHGGTSSSDYLVVNHLLAQLPVEKDRLGIQATEVLLAFPQSTGTREGVTQSVYAYLPIRNYGFKVGHLKVIQVPSALPLCGTANKV